VIDMATTNPITGDRMVSKTTLLDENFDIIFGKKKRETVVINQCEDCGAVVPCYSPECTFGKEVIK